MYRVRLEQGSIFWLDLDLPEIHKTDNIIRLNHYNLVGVQGPQRKILVVDDKEPNRSILTNLLRPLGFDVTEAIDGQDALHKALQIRPDAILMDLVMPVMDGFEATRQIQLSSSLESVVIIAISASVFDMDRLQSQKVGCNDFLSKPVREADLLECLSQHLKLEWIYEEKEGSDRVKEEFTQAAALPYADSIVAPPAEEISILLDLAMMGDLQGIIEQAARLEILDPQFVPFANHLRQLARSFKERQILEFVKQFQRSE